MAQKRSSNSTSSKNSRGRSASSKKPAASSRATSTKKQVSYEDDSESFFSVVWSYSWGKALYAVIILLVIIGLDFLISMNHYDRFFMVLGIEIIAGMIIGWIVYLLIERSKLQKQFQERSQRSSREE